MDKSADKLVGNDAVLLCCRETYSPSPPLTLPTAPSQYPCSAIYAHDQMPSYPILLPCNSVSMTVWGRSSPKWVEKDNENQFIEPNHPNEGINTVDLKSSKSIPNRNKVYTYIGTYLPIKQL